MNIIESGQNKTAESVGNLNCSYTLQDFFWPQNKPLSELYFRVVAGYADFNKRFLFLENGTRVSFNTYFNSFYEDYWKKYSSIDNAEVVLLFKGSIHVEMFRDTATNGCFKINWQSFSFETGGVATLRLPLFELWESGRIFIDVIAKADTEISYIGIRTFAHPNRAVRLTFGICTFNKEDYLLKNLSALTEYAKNNINLCKIIVVNQGEEFRNPKLKVLFNENGNIIQCINQGNWGGCGGFTRTMHESLNIKEANYHVLMDDDIQIDPRVITNLSAFISYLNKEIIVGGHMLDLLRPWVLYEAGAIIRGNTRIIPQHQNIDLRILDSLFPFTVAQDVDYNAWWFCAIPTKHIADAKYPAPIFIRGDDMEYGVRMKSIGVETVAMPGIAVWHEPFYLKTGGWQMYYDYRNRLILASLYPERFTLESPSYMLWVMMKALAVHDYQQAALIQMAIKDFLRGTSLFDENTSEQIHERVVNLSKMYQPEMAAENWKYKKSELKKIPQNRTGRQLLVFKRLLAAYLFGTNNKKPAFEFLDKDVHPAHIKAHAYLKTNGMNSYKLLYYPDRKKLYFLLKSCLSSYIKYRLHSKKIAKNWHDDIQRFREQDRWNNIFSKQ